MNPFQNKSPSPDFSNPSFQKEFVQDAESGLSLLQKELYANHAEQALLQQRITLMTEFLADLPSSDPQYSMLITSIEMDRVELSELKIRAMDINSRLS